MNNNNLFDWLVDWLNYAIMSKEQTKLSSWNQCVHVCKLCTSSDFEANICPPPTTISGTPEKL